MTKLKTVMICGVLALTPMSFKMAFAEDVGVAALALDGLHENDGTGLYDLVFKAVNSAISSKFDVVISSPAKSMHNFAKGKSVCMSPANTNPEFYQFNFETIQSRMMSEARIYIFTAAGTEPLSDLNALAGIRVGARKGMPYGTRIEGSGLNLQYSNSIEANIKKLQAGRIDAFIAYWPDVYAAFDMLETEYLPHDPDTPIAVHEDALLCRDDPEGVAAVEIFNAGMDAIDKSGELAAIMD